MNAQHSMPTSSFSHSATHSFNSIKTASNRQVLEDRAADKCQRILNYWLDVELFDIPDCPVYNEKDLLSIPLDDYDTTVIDKLTEQIKSGKQKINDKSRLLVMFQCHRAGYIEKEESNHPNDEPPRTYLAAQALIPLWNEDLQQLTWQRSGEQADLIINLAAMRTLYRRCPPPSSANMSLSDWVGARIEHIENRMAHWLQCDEDDVPLTSAALKLRLHELNSELTKEFWPHQKGKDFMLSQCQSIESRYQESKKTLTEYDLNRIEDEKKYKGIIKNNGDVTFRWRFCYYPEGADKMQLGPFYVKDLETCIQRLGGAGTSGLSLPLKRYLLGAEEQIKIDEAVDNGPFFYSLTNNKIMGRWPENPKFGLSLLQRVAVNVALKSNENPIVAVNGPPGTGKTTLLKDVIANSFVQRTKELSQLIDKEDWFDRGDAIRCIMQHSIIVASSNNKAVENISKELPAISKLYSGYQGSMSHFSEVAGEGGWGIFCAVLGNSGNRSIFKNSLKKLKSHLKSTSNIFQLNELASSLIVTQRQDAGNLIGRFARRWKEDCHLKLLALDIQDSHAARNKYASFLIPFADALIRIEDGDLSVESIVQSWDGFSDEQWEVTKGALLTFKKQWFGANKGQKYLQGKLDNVKEQFTNQYNNFLNADMRDPCWELDQSQYLANTQAYKAESGESLEDAEKRLQQCMPFASLPLNEARSQLFITALKLNEAILNTVAKTLLEDFGELEQLIDGRLETTEKIPSHQKLWSRLFLFFPVVSTSLSSVENQFRLMQSNAGFGLAVIDEAGQAVNYHVAGLLQRSQQAIFVGDPIQLEPVVSLSNLIDISVAEDFMPISREENQICWGDRYLISNSSAQTLADSACKYMSKIGERQVGIPLLVHRRCTEPMFSIANKIAYSEKMVMASQSFDWNALQSGWINIFETSAELGKRGYYNEKEAKAALQVVKHLALNQPQMLEGGVYIITPFSAMKSELINQCRFLLRDVQNHQWMIRAFGQQVVDKKQQSTAILECVGTVHAFQGKEASTVILCCAASNIRNKAGGIGWVNSKPNLINVAVTRAKHHLFVLGNAEDWVGGTVSSELQTGGMRYYESIEYWFKEQAKSHREMHYTQALHEQPHSGVSFSF